MENYIIDNKVNIMLRLVFIIIAFFLSLSLVLGQDDSYPQDLLYLKNGKIIKGSIQKEELGVVSILVVDTITSQTKLQMYQQSDVSRIVKASRTPYLADTLKSGAEHSNITDQVRKGLSSQKNSGINKPLELRTNQQNTDINIISKPLPKTELIEIPKIEQAMPIVKGEQLADPADPTELAKAPKPRRRYFDWYRQIRGFRMFIEYGYMVGIGQTKNNKMEILTSLGYQFNPIFYIGAGSGGTLSLNDKDHSLPIFINGRMNFLDEYTTPYIDVKTGYSVLEGRGFYFSASAGVSFTKKGKHAFNLGLTCTSQNVKYYEWEKGTQITIREAQHGLGLRIAFEF